MSLSQMSLCTVTSCGCCSKKQPPIYSLIYTHTGTHTKSCAVNKVWWCGYITVKYGSHCGPSGMQLSDTEVMWNQSAQVERLGQWWGESCPRRARLPESNVHFLSGHVSPLINPSISASASVFLHSLRGRETRHTSQLICYISVSTSYLIHALYCCSAAECWLSQALRQKPGHIQKWAELGNVL